MLTLAGDDQHIAQARWYPSMARRAQQTIRRTMTINGGRNARAIQLCVTMQSRRSKIPIDHRISALNV
jgi:hypothetical protein